MNLLSLRQVCLRAGLREAVRAGHGFPSAEQFVIQEMLPKNHACRLLHAVCARLGMCNCRPGRWSRLLGIGRFLEALVR